MSVSTHLWLYSPRNTRLANIAPAWSARKGYRFSYLRYRRSGHELTELILRMPKKSAPPRGFFALDSRIEVWRADGSGPARLDMETVWFVRVPPKLVYGPKGEQLIEVRAVNGLYLLAGRIVAYAAGSAQALKIGPADNVMKAVVRENLGSLAVAERNLSAWLTVDSDVGAGSNVYRTFPRANVLRVLQSLSRASAQGGNQVFFDVVPENGGLVFRTFLGQRGADHRHTAADPVTLSPEFGTLQNVEKADDHREEFTVIYTAGQGTGDTRMLVTLTDAERVNASPLNRREQFVDARYIPTAQGLSTEADAALWRGRPEQLFTGTLPPHVYGRRVRWGDRATAELDGEAVDCVLYGVEVELEDGQEVIRVDLRSDGADAESAVRQIEGVIDAGGGADAPIITVTPTAEAVPQAGSGGTIADGWLSSAIARVSQIPIALPPTGEAGGDLYDSYPSPLVKGIHGNEFENVAPNQGEIYVFDAGWPGFVISDVTGIKGVQEPAGVYKVPMAGASGKIADGWLNSTIARLTDLTWANISGKPSAFAPSAHATSHKHGGTDEVATATAAANAIPKAGAGGTLADAWLSTNIPRLASANTFTVAQAFTVTSGTAGATFAMMTYNALCSGVTAAGFGQDHYFNLEADSGTNRNTALMRVHWAVATDASRRGRMVFYVYDAVGARECLRLESTGAAPAVGFNGVAAVARQSLTALSMAVGTGDDSVADVGTVFSQATLNNNFRDLVNKINAIRTILVNVGIAV